LIKRVYKIIIQSFRKYEIRKNAKITNMIEMYKNLSEAKNNVIFTSIYIVRNIGMMKFII